MNFQGSSLVNNAEITGGSDVDGGADATDADSTPGDNSMDPADPNDNSTGDGDGTSPQDDDFDPAEVLLTQVFDLALTKDINTNQTPGPFVPGDQVRFNITVFNQGTLDAYDVDVIDDAPVGLSLPTLIGGGALGATQNAPGDFSIAFIPAGGSVTILVRSFIDATFQGTSLVNDAEITGGSDTDGGPDAMDVDLSLIHISEPTRPY